MQAVQHIFLCVGIIIVMARFMDVVLHGRSCLSCGGINAHKHDCPLRDDE